MQGLLRGAALAVDRHTGHLFGQSGGQPAGAGDVPGLRADGVEAAEDDVLDGGRVDTGALHQRGQRVRAEVGRVDGGQSAATPSDRGAHRFDDVGLGHGVSFCVSALCGSAYESCGAMPSSTIDRYCRAISSGLCRPPGRYQDAATQTVSRRKR